MRCVRTSTTSIILCTTYVFLPSWGKENYIETRRPGEGIDVAASDRGQSNSKYYEGVKVM